MFPNSLEGSLDMASVDEDFATLLQGFVMALKPRVILETGTHKGRSTRAICEGLKENGQGHIHTVDMVDYGVMASGAIRDDEKEYVTQVVGRTPDVFSEEPLKDLMGIDFAFIDGDHTRQGLIEDLQYVDAHRDNECLVLVDNARDNDWPDVEEFFSDYRDYPNFLLLTCVGTQIIQMR